MSKILSVAIIRNDKGRFVKGVHSSVKTEFKTGQPGYWLGKKRKKKMSRAGANNPAWKGGKPKCLQCRVECSNRKATYCQSCANKLFHSGAKNVNWKGGVTPLNEKERKSPAYRRWRRAVLKRDNFQCIWCGGNKDLEIDHIKPFAYYPKLRTELSNGRTLCLICHQKTFIFHENQYVKRKEVFTQ